MSSQTANFGRPMEQIVRTCFTLFSLSRNLWSQNTHFWEQRAKSWGHSLWMQMIWVLEAIRNQVMFHNFEHFLHSVPTVRSLWEMNGINREDMFHTFEIVEQSAPTEQSLLRIMEKIVRTFNKICTPHHTPHHTTLKHSIPAAHSLLRFIEQIARTCFTLLSLSSNLCLQNIHFWE